MCSDILPAPPWVGGCSRKHWRGLLAGAAPCDPAVFSAHPLLPHTWRGCETPGEVSQSSRIPSHPPSISCGGLTRMGAGCPCPRRGTSDASAHCPIAVSWAGVQGSRETRPLWLPRSSLEWHGLLSGRFAESSLPDPGGPCLPSSVERQLTFKSSVWDVARNPCIRAAGVISPLSSSPSADSGSGPPHPDAFRRRTWLARLQPGWVGCTPQRGARGPGMGLRGELAC